MAHDEGTFYRIYGTHLAVKFPQIEIEVIEMKSLRLDASSEKEPGDKLIAFIEKNNPSFGERSPCKELAWKVLDYMISSEMAKMNAQSFVSVASLPIRNADINKVGEWDAEPYKMLKPAMNAGWSFSNVYRAKLSDNMKEVISNAMTMR